MSREIIPKLSEYESLLKEVRELQVKIVELTALRDDLLYRVCPALKAESSKGRSCRHRCICGRSSGSWRNYALS